MSDVKLFRMGSAEVEELSGQSVPIEKSLQTLFEKNLEALLDTSVNRPGGVLTDDLEVSMKKVDDLAKASRCFFGPMSAGDPIVNWSTLPAQRQSAYAL